MVGTFWALVPPVLAIVLALITKETYSSLFVGILVGALFAAGFSPVGALDTMIHDGLIAGVADAWNVGIFIFLVILGILVAMVNKSGGSAAFGRWAEKNIKTRVGAQLATFVLGVLIFIDDYFNCLTVGSVMRPVTDRHKISRAKLAYLIDATAAPICMIAPISSWAAAVSATAEDLDTGISGIQLFIRAIPYNFYSLLTLVFILALTLMELRLRPHGQGMSARPARATSAPWRATRRRPTPRRGHRPAAAGDRADRHQHRRHDLRGRLLRRGRLGRHGLRRRLHRRLRQHGRLHRPALGRHHRPGLLLHLLPLPPHPQLQGVHGMRAQGLQGHGARHADPDPGRDAQEHDLRWAPPTSSGARWKAPPPAFTACCPPSSSWWPACWPSPPAPAGAPSAS